MACVTDVAVKPSEGLVFVLDVNRDYQAWLIERARLFAAMDT